MLSTGVDMPTLSIQQFQHPNLPVSLSFRKTLSNLSEKTVTTRVRQALKRIGLNNIIVSCKATFTNGRWIGDCIINGQSYTWEVK